MSDESHIFMVQVNPSMISQYVSTQSPDDDQLESLKEQKRCVNIESQFAQRFLLTSLDYARKVMKCSICL
jgi:hypothetical protein